MDFLVTTFAGFSGVFLALAVRFAGIFTSSTAGSVTSIVFDSAFAVDFLALGFRFAMVLDVFSETSSATISSSTIFVTFFVDFLVTFFVDFFVTFFVVAFLVTFFVVLFFVAFLAVLFFVVDFLAAAFLVVSLVVDFFLAIMNQPLNKYLVEIKRK